ncbi:response regulator aspartate phosphatase [Bacillus sp. D-CC]
MNIQITGNKLITKMLNDWYQNIRAQRVSEANKLKEEIDKRLHIIENLKDNSEIKHLYLLR